MYIYENHLGGLFTSTHKLSFEERYCDSCGDTDTLIGFATDRENAWQLLKNITSTLSEKKCEQCPHYENWEYCEDHCEDYQDSGGWDYDYVQNFLNETFK